MNKRDAWSLWLTMWVLVTACSTVGAQLPRPAQQVQRVAPTLSPLSALVVSVQPQYMANTGARPAELVCPRKGPAPSRPALAPAEPTEIPDEAEIEQALKEASEPSGARLANPSQAGALRPEKTNHLRIAIWGDSHMAAAFFSDQMLRQLTGPAGPNANPFSSRFVHAGVGHGGVRALVRKTCMTGEWAREMAYAHGDAAAAPGPGMTSLVAKKPGATLALDLRDAQGLARHTRLQLLHHGDPSDPIRLAISVDGEAETQLTLTPQAGPNALALSTDLPLSTLQIRVLEGSFRFQGIKLPESATSTSNPAPLHLDLFAYPGATVAGWVRSDLAYLASWFTDQPYDLALIAFGTNEGNDPRFSETAYRDTLNKALGNFRQVFPQTQCVLIGPGDRGIRVAKSKTAKANKGTPKQAANKQDPKAKSSKNSKPVKPNPSPSNLLKYSRIHAQIGQIQTELAAQHGCLAWSMQEAMGGIGSAYPWARKNPPLMAPDLIHFTPAGYRELANRFMADFGLTAP
jgi:lysophospholipase L1-like esterase